MARLHADNDGTLNQNTRFGATPNCSSRVYACSEQASATSGAALSVEGGVVRFVA